MTSILLPRIVNGQTRCLMQNSVRYQRSPLRQPEKKSREVRLRQPLNQHKDKRLALGEMGKYALQFEAPSMEPEPHVVTKERKLPPLHESMPPYHKYSQDFIDKQTKFGTWFDPLFNPHLHEERNKVNPDEEPFNAIYVDSNTECGDEFTKVRDITTPELWEHVERLARIRIAPEPPMRKAGSHPTPLPSGFVPPPESPPDLPYFIPRTRNFLLPVYYRLEKDPIDCTSYVMRVQGDIWQFEDDLRTHLESLQAPGTRILTSVRETEERVDFRGKHIREIVNWLHAQGF